MPNKAEIGPGMRFAPFRAGSLLECRSALSVNFSLPTHKLALLAMAGLAISSCKSAGTYRHQADRAAYDIVEQAQEEALGKTEPFTIERPKDELRRRLLLGQKLPHADDASLGAKALEPVDHWPNDDYLKAKRNPTRIRAKDARPLAINLIEALKIGALNSREYQSRKEDVYRAALDLDLERDYFRPMFGGSAESTMSWDVNGNEHSVSGVENTGELSLSQNFTNGISVSANLGADLVKLLTQEESSSRGLFGDATVTVPLMRGAGKHIVTEPLTQAERDVIYAIHDFERFKRTFAVQVASSYLQTLRQMDEVANSEENYKSLVLSARRARRLADAGRLPEIQVDQALQDELRARDRWISAQQSYEARLDSLKVLLGLPTDAAVELDREEFERFAEETAANLKLEPAIKNPEQTDAVSAEDEVELISPTREGGGPWELEESTAIALALDHRLDLRTRIGQVADAQRKVVVAADQLRADLTFGGNGSAGARRTLSSAGLEDANIHLDEATYAAFLTLDLPLERTRERNTYRNSLIGLENAVRDVQELEDNIKADVRESLRTLLESREGVQIQAQSVKLAERRVESTDLFLQAGRAEIRDLLEAQEDLVSAQNALTAAIVNYRIAELELQRDLGVLEMDEKGLWHEPEELGGNP